MAKLRQGKPYVLEHLARMPNDQVLRPSAHGSTISPIRCQHELVVEVHFINAKGQRRVMEAKKGIQIASVSTSALLLKGLAEFGTVRLFIGKRRASAVH